jgi:short subunit dehydrogenase/transcriptional regulator SbtR-like protein
MQMTDNTVLVTGGGTGIGRGLAESLHRLGNRVVIAGRRSEPLQATASANPGIEYLHLDQSDPADIQRVAAELTDRYPDINVVLNNAGIQLVEDLTGGDVAAAESMVAINLLGPIRLTAALLPTLMAQPRAAILNVTSGLGFVPNHVNPTYSATKAALHFTLYRHFPNRESLVLAVYRHEVAELADLAPQLLKSHPPLEALRLWFGRLAHYGRIKHGLADVLHAATIDGLAGETYQPVSGALTTLLDACDDTGVTRAGLDPDDVLLLVGFLWRIDPNADWEERTGRMLDIVIDGLRKQSVG